MRRILAWALCAPLLLFLAACAAAPGDLDAPMDEARAAHLISAALQNIEDIYYREAEASVLVEAGLAHLAETYPEIRYQNDGGSFTVGIEDRPVSTFAPPAGPGNASRWGDHLANALDLIDKASPEASPNLDDLTDAFLEGMTDALDRGTTYWSPADSKRRLGLTRANAGSVNVSLSSESQSARIASINNFALEESGLLKVGDDILAIDGEDVTDLPPAEVLYRLRGAIGSPVVLTIQRQGRTDPLDVELVRELRGAGSVASYSNGASRRILIRQLNGSTADEVKRTLTPVMDGKEGKPGGIVLDLRDNTGGLLQATIAISDLFMTQGRIISTHGRHADSHQFFKAAKYDVTEGLPLVVLVNGRTGSGAEIVAAALQDNGRAIIIGQTTFGHGTIQTVMPLPNRGHLSLTWTEVHTPAEYRLDRRGVMPMVCTGGEVTADQVLAALRNGTGGIIDEATRNRDIDPDDTAAIAAFRALCPPREDGADVALEVAQALLADPALYAAVLNGAAH